MNSWLKRLRHWLRVLFSPPASATVESDFGRIDDGVPYGLPPSVPYELTLPGHEAALAETVARLAEVSTDYQMPFDTPYNKTGERLWAFPFVVPLREWDWSTRRQILERCHLAYERNPLAKRAVKVTTEFVVGTGLTITYRNEEVQDVLETFRDNPENNISGYEKELCNDLQVDGEIFIRFFKNEAGEVVIVPLRPWEIAWIETDPQFIKRVKSYHRQGYLSNGIPGNVEQVIDDIPGDEVVHVAINKASYEQRGRPDLFVILPWLRAYKDWLEGRARANHWRGAIFADMTITGGTPIQVATKRAQYKQPPPPGSLYIHNDKEAMEYKDSKVGAPDVAEDGRQIKLMSAVGKGLPEYMLSDGQNANLASASAQQLPALRTFTEFQDVTVEELWRPIYRHAIQVAIAAGTLPGMVAETDDDGEPVVDEDGAPQMIKAVDAFDLSAPELESDDPYNLAQALQLYMANDLVSKETASGEAGYDYRVEKRKLEAEKAEAAADQLEQRAQGLAPGPLPTTIPPEPTDSQAQPAPAANVPAQSAQNATPPAKSSPSPVESVVPSNGHSRTIVEPLIVNLPATNVPMDFAEKVGVLFTEAIERGRREIVPEIRDAINRTDALEGKVDQLGGDVARLSDASQKREQDVLAAFNSIMTRMEEQSETPPPVIELDEELIRAIASETATQVVASAQVVTNEITSRDAQGRPLEIRRLLASGQSVIYRVKRDDQGNSLALERI